MWHFSLLVKIKQYPKYFSILISKLKHSICFCILLKHIPFLHVKNNVSKDLSFFKIDNNNTRKTQSFNLLKTHLTIIFPPPITEDEEDFDVEEEDNMYVPRMSQPDPAIDTSRVEEIPAKEPKFHAVPLKSVLKKRGSGSGPGTPQNTPTQENRPLTLRQELHASFKLVQQQAISLLTGSPSDTFLLERLDGHTTKQRKRFIKLLI